MTPNRINELRQKLEDMLADITTSEYGSVESLLDGAQALPDTMDQASMETDLKINLVIRERERQRKREIRWALRMIAEGTYGICEECGEAIAPMRLMAFPATTLCVACKEAMEQEAILGMAR